MHVSMTFLCFQLMSNTCPTKTLEWPYVFQDESDAKSTTTYPHLEQSPTSSALALQFEQFLDTAMEHTVDDLHRQRRKRVQEDILVNKFAASSAAAAAIYAVVDDASASAASVLNAQVENLNSSASTFSDLASSQRPESSEDEAKHRTPSSSSFDDSSSYSSVDTHTSNDTQSSSDSESPASVDSAMHLDNGAAKGSLVGESSCEHERMHKKQPSANSYTSSFGVFGPDESPLQFVQNFLKNLDSKPSVDKRTHRRVPRSIASHLSTGNSTSSDSDVWMEDSSAVQLIDNQTLDPEPSADNKAPPRDGTHTAIGDCTSSDSDVPKEDSAMELINNVVGQTLDPEPSADNKAHARDGTRTGIGNVVHLIDNVVAHTLDPDSSAHDRIHQADVSVVANAISTPGHRTRQYIDDIVDVTLTDMQDFIEGDPLEDGYLF